MTKEKISLNLKVQNPSLSSGDKFDKKVRESIVKTKERVLQKIANSIEADSMWFTDVLLDYLKDNKILNSFETYLDQQHLEGDFKWSEEEKSFYEIGETP